MELSDKNIMKNDEESKALEVALLELHTLGLIEFKDDETFTATEKGFDNALNVLHSLPVKDQVMLVVAVDDLLEQYFERINIEKE